MTIEIKVDYDVAFFDDEESLATTLKDLLTNAMDLTSYQYAIEVKQYVHEYTCKRCHEGLEKDDRGNGEWDWISVDAGLILCLAGDILSRHEPVHA